MAKRTNKTDHVLNLLAGGEEKKENKKNRESGAQPPVDPESAVSVIDPMDEEAKLAETIKKSLESELEEEYQEEVIPEEPVTETLSQTEELMVNETNLETTEDEVIHQDIISDEKTTQEVQKEENIEDEDTKTEKNEYECDDDEFAKSFVFVNVMEKLVEEKVGHYMEQFGVCMCSRCRADVMAVALTKLPAKYVVVNKATVSPLINFYSNKFAGQITVEITKACIRVNESPHHNRE
jgi:hypothetical protein